jgi:alcohol dehydrogenase class IV
MRLIAENLPKAVKDGKNLVARANMMAAASMGATAFQKGLGGMHAISHPLGALYNTHHGLTNAVVMPYVLEFNREAIDERMIRLARFLGLPNPSFKAVMVWILALRKEIGIAHTLKDIGVDDKRVDEVAKAAEADPSAGGNPIKVGAKELGQIFVAALTGKLAA